ncbi:hypothetical protein [Salinibacillus xinjiangensis]|uniref:Uncharacterized protein n=1 Tax=Salinibacillus xinjiangensis TaxID=1229268 RepID=A0A6G1XA80_9BACI|nr:hypothetical protein [Salinibacillus xinjiangensis]MRG87806.1 hypothetical protein [Salinibacillus xinjiangensis]
MKEENLMEELRTFPNNKTMGEQSKVEIEKAIQEEARKRRNHQPIKQSSGGFPFKGVVISVMSAAVLFLAGTFLYNEIQLNEGVAPLTDNSGSDDPKPSIDNEDPNEQETQEQTPEELDKQSALEVMETFKTTFVRMYSSSDENLKIPEAQSIEDIKEEFRTIMSDELAEWYAESYYREENGEVFVVAMDGPTWLEADIPYDLEKISETKFKINQERDNEQLGHRIMSYVLIYEEGHWKVDDIETEVLE